jgi:hypothetical protein
MKQLCAGVVALLGVAFLLNVNEAQEKPKYSIKEVMKKAMAGKSALVAKVKDGSATDAEKQQLVDLFTSLHASTPPKGNPDNWKKMTDALLAAAKSGDAKAITAAANCKVCHSEHKGK